MKKPYWEWFKPVFIEVYRKSMNWWAHPLMRDLLEEKGTLQTMMVMRSRVLSNKGLREDTPIFTVDEMIGDRKPRDVPQEEWNGISEWAIYSVFQAAGEKIFKIAREFGENLARAPLDIDHKYLPTFKGQLICIEFPEALRFHDPVNNDYFQCAFVACEENTHGAIDYWGQTPKKIVDILFPCLDTDGNAKLEANNLVVTFREGDTLQTSMERARNRSSHPIHCDGVVEFVLKCLVYIDSGNPDLREYRAPRTPKTENVKKLRRWTRQHDNLSLLDMTLVGYDFKKPREYQVGETLVTGHFRWQPYGENRSKVKLIWIEPFTRQYGKAEEENG